MSSRLGSSTTVPFMFAASRSSHEEIDESPELDEGDPERLAGDYLRLRARHPAITILGGCCGTDARHIRAIADAVLPANGAR